MQKFPKIIIRKPKNRRRKLASEIQREAFLKEINKILKYEIPRCLEKSKRVVYTKSELDKLRCAIRYNKPDRFRKLFSELNKHGVSFADFFDFTFLFHHKQDFLEFKDVIVYRVLNVKIRNIVFDLLATDPTGNGLVLKEVKDFLDLYDNKFHVDGHIKSGYKRLLTIINHLNLSEELGLSHDKYLDLWKDYMLHHSFYEITEFEISSHYGFILSMKMFPKKNILKQLLANPPKELSGTGEVNTLGDLIKYYGFRNDIEYYYKDFGDEKRFPKNWHLQNGSKISDVVVIYADGSYRVNSGKYYQSNCENNECFILKD